jgi:1,4-dihydroxy-2-naphthoate octaprenyltransferase
MGCFVILALQVVFFALSVFSLNISLSQVSWWVYVFSLTAPLAIITVSELIKSHDKEEWQKFQKRSKLEFSTKLGMHSPL